MYRLSNIFYKLLNLPLSMLVKSKSIPASPAIELGLDTSNSSIIYILPYKSKADLLTLRAQCIIHGLPDPLDPIIVDDTKLPRYVFVVFKKKQLKYYSTKEESVQILNHYLNVQCRKQDLNIKLVPVYVMFGRKPGRYKGEFNKSLRILNCVHKLIAVTLLGRDSFVSFSPYVSLRCIANKHGTDKTIALKLARVARMHFARKLIAAVGPTLPARQDLFKKLLSSKAIVRAVEYEKRSKNLSHYKAQQKALNIMKEMAAHFSYKMIRLTDRILGFICNRLYQGINIHNAERVRKIANYGHEIVYVPCHRSHMDYLLLSYVLYHQGLVPPHIAAGINLNFWPAGPIFRRLGAFFIHRTFNRNKLYSTILREYIGELLSNGYSLAYFVEGGRSRTGLLLEPKTGTLSITIQSMLRCSNRPITLVPIYIGYEHVIEVSTYAKELRGATKKKESFQQMLRCIRKLRNCGLGYVNFGEPMQLMTYLNKHVPEWRKSDDVVRRPEWLTPTVNAIAADLMVRINSTGAANAINLCCTALLASSNNSLTRKQLTKQLDCYLNIMRNVPYSIDSTVPSATAGELIDHALQINKLEVVDKDTIILPREQAIIMTYYRNNIAHMLVLPSLIAAIITKHRYIYRNELLRKVNLLYPMLKAELFLRWSKNELATELDKLTYELLRQKLIAVNNNELQINTDTEHINTLLLLAAGIRETLQRYAITFWLLNANPSINRCTLEKNSRKLAQQISIQHGIKTLEFLDKGVFSTLVLTLRDEGYIRDNLNSDIKSKSEDTIKVYNILSELITYDVRLSIEKYTL